MTGRVAREAAAVALGDQVQAVCDASGQTVLGFAVFIKDPRSNGVSVEARSHLDGQVLNLLIQAYLDAGGAH